MTYQDRGNVLDWLQAIIDEPESWHKWYSESEVKTIAEQTIDLLKGGRKIMNHLEAAETIARILYDGDRKIAFTEEELIALQWAVKEMRLKAKELHDIERTTHI